MPGPSDWDTLLLIGDAGAVSRDWLMAAIGLSHYSSQWPIWAGPVRGSECDRRRRTCGSCKTAPSSCMNPSQERLLSLDDRDLLRQNTYSVRLRASGTSRLRPLILKGN
jgi:hypothetical protein